MIDVNHLTLCYPSKKGVFNLNFHIKKGEVTGYLGPNGAGKTTTIRALMGFMQPDSGTCAIGGRPCFADAPQIQKTLGYIPGEIAFLEGMRGDEYLKFISEMRGIKNPSREKELLDLFELSPKGSIKKYSKGMKQKLGIVAAFMHDPEVLILDEPTSGLDPLMQTRFIELILAEKQRGKTVLMSSHIFEEIERTCDNVLMIKDGRIVAHADIETLKSTKRRGFVIKTPTPEQAVKLFNEEGFSCSNVENGCIEVFTAVSQIDRFAKLLPRLTLTDLSAKAQTLEDVFMNYYTRED